MRGGQGRSLLSKLDLNYNEDHWRTSPFPGANRGPIRGRETDVRGTRPEGRGSRGGKPRREEYDPGTPTRGGPIPGVHKTVACNPFQHGYNQHDHVCQSRILEFTGYSQEDLAKGFEATDMLVPADRERARQKIRRLFSGEEVGTSEYTALRKDGSTFPVLVRTAPVFIDGKVGGLRGFLLDLTEHKRAEEALRESEEKYRQLFLTESDALVLFCTDTGEIIEGNDAALDMYGYDKEAFLKLKIPDFSAEPEHTRKSMQEHIAMGRGKVPLRYHKKKDGTSFPVEISTSTFMLGGRQVLCGAVRDIGDRVRAEEELKKHRDTLEGLVAERTTELEDANRRLKQEIRFRNRVEQALREGEERFRTVFEGSLDAIILVDPETGESLMQTRPHPSWSRCRTRKSSAFPI